MLKQICFLTEQTCRAQSKSTLCWTWCGLLVEPSIMDGLQIRCWYGLPSPDTSFLSFMKPELPEWVSGYLGNVLHPWWLWKSGCSQKMWGRWVGRVLHQRPVCGQINREHWQDSWNPVNFMINGRVYNKSMQGYTAEETYTKNSGLWLWFFIV